MVQPISSVYPTYKSPYYRDSKDPCPVYNVEQKLYHLYGSVGDAVADQWDIFHATGPTVDGPWTEKPVISLKLTGAGVAAPGVIYDPQDGLTHMMIQTEYSRAGGTIEYLTSKDGDTFKHVRTLMKSSEGTSHHGIYDPHPSIINGWRYMVYSAMGPFENHCPKPDLYLAKSVNNTWGGPWIRMGQILNHHDVSWHHNTYNHPEYEWGLEGAQLVELSDGRVLLIAVCFLPFGCSGSRQRVFFAIADDIESKFESLGPILQPEHSGENGHAAALVENDELVLFYQSRCLASSNTWYYATATYQMNTFPVEIKSQPGYSTYAFGE
jgi:hypothetical protein